MHLLLCFLHISHSFKQASSSSIQAAIRFSFSILILRCNMHLWQVLLYRSQKNSNIETKHLYDAMATMLY